MPAFLAPPPSHCGIREKEEDACPASLAIIREEKTWPSQLPAWVGVTQRHKGMHHYGFKERGEGWGGWAVQSGKRAFFFKKKKRRVNVEGVQQFNFFLESSYYRRTGDAIYFRLNKYVQQNPKQCCTIIHFLRPWWIEVFLSWRNCCIDDLYKTKQDFFQTQCSVFTAAPLVVKWSQNVMFCMIFFPLARHSRLPVSCFAAAFTSGVDTCHLGDARTL